MTYFLYSKARLHQLRPMNLPFCSKHDAPCTMYDARRIGRVKSSAQAGRPRVRALVLQAPSTLVTNLKECSNLHDADGLKPSKSLLCLCEKIEQLAGHRNIVGMVGICGTTIVTKYYDAFTKTAHQRYRQPPIAEVLSMALDAARGLQVRLLCTLP